MRHVAISYDLLDADFIQTYIVCHMVHAVIEFVFRVDHGDRDGVWCSEHDY